MFAIFRKPLTVTRQQVGSYVDGIWTPGAATSLTINASVQPTSPEDMQKLPEGRRDRQSFMLYCDTLLREADDNAGTDADTVQINGDTYQVEMAAPWDNGIVPHNVALITKKDQQQ